MKGRERRRGTLRAAATREGDRRARTWLFLVALACALLLVARPASLTAFTGQLGTVNSQLGNIVLGAGSPPARVVTIMAPVAPSPQNVFGQ